MNRPRAISMQRLPREPEHALVDGSAALRKPSRRCKVNMVAGSGPCPVREVTLLLHSRLRIVVLVLLIAFSIFFFRLLLDGHSDTLEEWTAPFHGVVAGVTGVLALVLWSRHPLCLRSLRAIELVLFGLAGAYFAWLQFLVFHDREWARYAASGEESILLRLAASMSAFRWFCLLVVYGTFIPNTGRRSAVIAAIAALLPLGITTAICLAEGTFTPQVSGSLVDMGVIMAIGAVVAVFGAHRIDALRLEAFEARQLGQYRLKELLGSGGMGEVYLAEHMLLRRPCAVKLIRPEQAGDPANLSRFEREVQATATLTHWNTVEIFDYGRTADGTFYYVMEYLPGLSLESLVEQHGPLAPERAVHFLRQVCAGLREAHSIGLIHRDIKPSNVIACERGGVYDVAKVVDFGLVHNVGFGKADVKLTVEGTILGSPQYMSPEQAAGKDSVDGRTDIYSLGAVAYFLLSGRPPFVRDTAMELLIAHTYEPAGAISDLRPDVPDDLQEVVLRCLQKEPGKRFQSIDELGKALARCECAGLWSDDKAASWWQGRVGKDTDAELSRLTGPTSPLLPVHGYMQTRDPSMAEN